MGYPQREKKRKSHRVNLKAEESERGKGRKKKEKMRKEGSEKGIFSYIIFIRKGSFTS